MVDSMISPIGSGKRGHFFQRRGHAMDGLGTESQTVDLGGTKTVALGGRDVQRVGRLQFCSC